jgi:hypothetical protein
LLAVDDDLARHGAAVSASAVTVSEPPFNSPLAWSSFAHDKVVADSWLLLMPSP